jgi:hypothetical protein
VRRDGAIITLTFQLWNGYSQVDVSTEGEEYSLSEAVAREELVKTQKAAISGCCGNL